MMLRRDILESRSADGGADGQMSVRLGSIAPRRISAEWLSMRQTAAGADRVRGYQFSQVHYHLL
jgi:hypothetical protein